MTAPSCSSCKRRPALPPEDFDGHHEGLCATCLERRWNIRLETAGLHSKPWGSESYFGLREEALDEASTLPWSATNDSNELEQLFAALREQRTLTDLGPDSELVQEVSLEEWSEVVVRRSRLPCRDPLDYAILEKACGLQSVNKARIAREVGVHRTTVSRRLAAIRANYEATVLTKQAFDAPDTVTGAPLFEEPEPGKGIDLGRPLPDEVTARRRSIVSAVRLLPVSQELFEGPYVYLRSIVPGLQKAFEFRECAADGCREQLGKANRRRQFCSDLCRVRNHRMRQPSPDNR